MIEQWNELKETIIELRDNNGTATQQECCQFLANLMNVLEVQMTDFPTVDVVEVVRCKDCIYYLHSSEICGIIDTRLHFYETDKTWADDCFCSWGERKE